MEDKRSEYDMNERRFFATCTGDGGWEEERWSAGGDGGDDNGDG